MSMSTYPIYEFDYYDFPDEYLGVPHLDPMNEAWKRELEDYEDSLEEYGECHEYSLSRENRTDTDASHVAALQPVPSEAGQATSALPQSLVEPQTIVPGESSTDEALSFVRHELHEAVQATAALLKVPSTASTYGELFLSLIVDPSHARQMRSFMETLRYRIIGRSLVPVDEFANKPDRQNWDVHDIKLNRQWGQFCEDLQQTTDQVVIKEMAAPSGPDRSKITFLWHYPTNTSPNTTYSHVLDPGSKIVGIQKNKIGFPRDVKTVNLIPIRIVYNKAAVHHEPKWAKSFSDWGKIYPKCLEFVDEVTSNDKLVVAMGIPAFKELVKMAERRGWSVKKGLLATRVKFFEGQGHFAMARDSKGQIQQVILRSCHGQTAFHNVDIEKGAVWDLLYNAACDFAGVPIKNLEYFAWRSTNVRPPEQPTLDELRKRVGITNYFELHRQLADWEKTNKIVIQWDDIEEFFAAELRDKPRLREIADLFREKNYSPLDAIRHYTQMKGNSTREANSAKRKAEEALEHPEPSKKRGAAQRNTYWGPGVAAWDKVTAVMASQQVQYVLARREDMTALKPGERRAIRKIDQLRECHADPDGQTPGYLTRNQVRMEVILDFQIQFYSKTYQGGFPYQPGQPGFPWPADDPHPAMMLCETEGVSGEGIKEQFRAPRV
ncbi:hypothetical protein HIM_05444 [Hirsutella minnesotensis 3608]|uniref:Uncharacterized protein n=1 Tax=Hirsutella minnesotensis 3608 TaxID=1043627 RepID=A0A0F7ZPC3_9HYPO|nr:hypothetical protein HIM_05444 [Hirsutella minnesotensis 3608]